MKILMISPGPHNEVTSGLGFAAERLSQSLSEKVELIIIEPGDVTDQASESGIDTGQFEDGAVVQDMTRIMIKANLSPYAYYQPESESSSASSDVRSELDAFTQGILEIVGSLDFDLVYAHDWVTFDAAQLLKKKFGKPLVLHVHSLDVDRISSSNHSWVFDLEKDSFGLADAIIAVSNYTANRINRFYDVPSKKIRTIYNGFTLDLFPNYEKVFEDPVVLFAGRLSGQKSPQTFIEIAEKVLEKNQGTRFVMAGDGAMKNSLIELAAHKGIGDRIHFTGYVERVEMAKLFAECTIFCMPSISEPFGLAAIEAAHAGLPVVISKQSGATEVLPKALVAEGGDTDGFADHILSIIENKVNIEAAISGNKDAIKSLTWDRAASSVIEVFKTLV